MAKRQYTEQQNLLIMCSEKISITEIPIKRKRKVNKILFKTRVSNKITH